MRSTASLRESTWSTSSWSQPPNAASPTARQCGHRENGSPQPHSSSSRSPRAHRCTDSPIALIPGTSLSIRSSSVDPDRPNPPTNAIRGRSGLGGAAAPAGNSPSTSVPSRRVVAATSADSSTAGPRPAAAAASSAARSEASSSATVTRPLAPSRRENRSWWSSTCSPRAGSRGTTIGTCPALRASAIVAGPPWLTTASACAISDCTLSQSRYGWPVATSGGRELPCCTSTSAPRSAAQRSTQPTSRSNRWKSVPTRTSTLGVTAAVPRRPHRDRRSAVPPTAPGKAERRGGTAGR